MKHTSAGSRLTLLTKVAEHIKCDAVHVRARDRVNDVVYLSFWVGMSPEDAPLASNSRGETDGAEGSRRAVQPRGDRKQPDSTLKPLRSNQVGTGARPSNAAGGSWMVTGLD